MGASAASTRMATLAPLKTAPLAFLQFHDMPQNGLGREQSPAMGRQKAGKVIAFEPTAETLHTN